MISSITASILCLGVITMSHLYLLYVISKETDRNTANLERLKTIVESMQCRSEEIDKEITGMIDMLEDEVERDNS